DLNSKFQAPHSYLEQLETGTIDSIITGDTFASGEQTLKLAGIRAPAVDEDRQPLDYYGRETFEFARDKIKSSDTIYMEEKTDNRVYLFLEDGSLLNAQLLEQGMAYLEAESGAQYYEEMKTAAELSRVHGRGIRADLENADGSFPIINWEQAEEHIENRVKVEGKVRIVYQSHRSDRLLLGFRENNWRDCFTVIIPGDIATSFPENPRQHFLDKKIKVKGRLKELNNTPEITLSFPEQISIID
ncbi:MAG: thermonuclease family protein, partial [Bacillota bacterium]